MFGGVAKDPGQYKSWPMVACRIYGGHGYPVELRWEHPLTWPKHECVKLGMVFVACVGWSA